MRLIPSFFVLFIWFTSTLHFDPISALRTYNEERLNQLRNEVKDVFYHAYDSYIKYAYPYDELRPLSCDGIDTWGSYSLTLIDALDTLVVMGNYSEFRRVAELIINNAHFDLNINVSVFETNIRIIGGLLSAHLLSHKAGMELEKGWPCNGPLLRLAEKVARKILPAFDTKTGMPYGTVNLRYGVPPNETPVTCTAGVGTFIVEFGTLSRLTGDPVYEKVALRALYSLYSKRSSLDLVGNHIDTNTGKWTAIDSGIGAGVDSYFEYLVKGAILFDKSELMHMFQVSFNAIDKHLEKGGWYVWATMTNAHISAATFQSLESFWPGLLSLVGNFEPALKAIANYHRIWKQYGGLPELYNILQGKASSSREGYPLRPELIESAMYIYRGTGNPHMLEIGEDMLHSIQKSARTECGYATIRDVTTLTLEDRMESFFLAETVKYLYLLFDPNNFLHDDEHYTPIQTPNGKCTIYAGGYIFNTEAHPIDPSALHCCSGDSERDLHEEVAIIDEFDIVSEKFIGRKVVSDELKGGGGRKWKRKRQNSDSGSNKNQEGKGRGESEQIEDAYSSETTSYQSQGCSEDLEEPRHPLLSFIKSKNGVCRNEGGPNPPENKEIDQSTFLERLIRKLFDEESDKAKIEKLKVNLASGNIGDKDLPELLANEYTVSAQLSSKKKANTLIDAKKLEELIQTFESNPKTSQASKENKQFHFEDDSLIIKSSSTTPKTPSHQGEVKSLKKPRPPTSRAKHHRVQQPIQTVITPESTQSNRIYLPPKGTRETPDLDLIFGTSARSLSFSFSLRWLKYFPDLIRQLIPTERFDIQNFYSRMSPQLTPESLALDFNITRTWQNDYSVLSCPLTRFTDRFLFFRSSVDD